MEATDIEIIELAEQPAMVVRRKVEVEQLGATLGDILPRVFGYVIEAGQQPAGMPFMRYFDMDGGYRQPGRRAACAGGARTLCPQQAGINPLIRRGFWLVVQNWYLFRYLPNCESLGALVGFFDIPSGPVGLQIDQNRVLFASIDS